MAEQDLILTLDGRQKLEDELSWREGEHLKEITEQIKTAKDFGDLSENAEYDAAQEEQAKIDARLSESRNILSRAKIAEAGVTGAVSIGSQVTIKAKGAKQSITYTLVGTTETDSLHNRISNESPVGAALMGKKKGDTIKVVTPSGKKAEFKIEKIEQ